MRKKGFFAVLLAAAMVCAAAQTAAAAEASGEGAYGTLLGAGKLAAPTEFTKSPGATTCTVTWNKIEGADAYKVLLYDAAKKKYAAVKSVKKNTYKFTGLTEATAYKFKIEVYDKVKGSLVKQSTSKVQKFNTTAKPESISLSAKKAQLEVEGSVTVKATVTPKGFKDVKWSITNGPTGAVSLQASGASCTVTGVKAGTVTLTAAAGGKKANIVITVKEPEKKEEDKKPQEEEDPRNGVYECGDGSIAGSIEVRFRKDGSISFALDGLTWASYGSEAEMGSEIYFTQYDGDGGIVGGWGPVRIVVHGDGTMTVTWDGGLPTTYVKVQ